MIITIAAPTGFCFDILCDDPPIQDDPEIFDNNVKDEFEAFINEHVDMLTLQSRHIMLTMGMILTTKMLKCGSRIWTN